MIPMQIFCEGGVRIAKKESIEKIVDRGVKIWTVPHHPFQYFINMYLPCMALAENHMAASGLLSCNTGIAIC